MQQAQLRQDLLGVFVPLLGQHHLHIFLVHPIVAFGAVFFFLRREMSGHLVHDLVQLNVVVGLPRNNQRRARFVNQDAVHFVHHGEVELALDFVVDVVHHVVAQVVKAEFIVRAVGDVAAVGLLAVE